MNTNASFSALLLGVCIALGLAALGFQLAQGVERFRALERTVTVKGLAEREVAADVAVWPIRFSEAANSSTPTSVRVANLRGSGTRASNPPAR